MSYDFANILFAGPCNARCPACIGRQLDARLSPDNLRLYPPRNLEAFIALIQKHGVRQVVFSGTTTDPQLYRHEARLLDELRRRLPPETQFSLHSNGRLALRKMAVFNSYDRVTLSLPSFDPYTYRAMMGVPDPPDLAEIVRQARPPVKVSCLVDDHNRGEMPRFLEGCLEAGIRRLVLRKPYGERRSWEALLPLQALDWSRQGEYRGNPVYRYQSSRCNALSKCVASRREMEVTLWDFEQSQSTALNLFSSGLISRQYLLAGALIKLRKAMCPAGVRRDAGWVAGTLVKKA